MSVEFAQRILVYLNRKMSKLLGWITSTAHREIEEDASKKAFWLPWFFYIDDCIVLHSDIFALGYHYSQELYKIDDELMQTSLEQGCKPIIPDNQLKMTNMEVLELRLDEIEAFMKSREPEPRWSMYTVHTPASHFAPDGK